MQNKFKIGGRVVEVGDRIFERRHGYGAGTVVSMSNNGTLDVEFSQQRCYIRPGDCEHLNKDNHEEVYMDDDSRTEMNGRKRNRMIRWWTILGLTILFGIIALGMYGCPQYYLYQRALDGQANLKRAEFQSKIAIEQARVKAAAAKLLAKAEVERAKGVAKANQIIGTSLKDNDAYLRYLWIQGLHDGSSEIIYVPTEANLPILEAGRASVWQVKKVEPVDEDGDGS